MCFTRNAIKLVYGDVEIKNFSGQYTSQGRPHLTRQVRASKAEDGTEEKGK